MVATIRYLLVSTLALCCALNCAVSSESGAENAPVVNETDLAFTLVNLNELAEENPLENNSQSSVIPVASEENASINFVQMVPGASIPLHYHGSHDELVYIIEGEGRMEINGEELILQPSDMLYIPSGVIHSLTAINDENLKAISIFAPAFDGVDRVYVQA
ncbi:MAG TPA: cupin domain-containing protein [Methanothrix sp.]|nr:cupin domain-containing protein [Methanothrix sp.]